MITCPFCCAPDFDLIGLKLHLIHGHCAAYEQTIVNDAAEARRWRGAGIQPIEPPPITERGPLASGGVVEQQQTTDSAPPGAGQATAPPVQHEPARDLCPVCSGADMVIVGGEEKPCPNPECYQGTVIVK